MDMDVDMALHCRQVYILTASVSVFAYIWLLFMVVWSTPGVITLTEAVLTFVFFWILLLAAYLCDRKCFLTDKKQISPMSKTVGDLTSALPDQSSKGGAGPTGEGQVKPLTPPSHPQTRHPASLSTHPTPLLPSPSYHPLSPTPTLPRHALLPSHVTGWRPRVAARRDVCC